MGELNLSGAKMMHIEKIEDKSFKWKSCLRTNMLTLLTVGGVVGGVVLGFALRSMRDDRWPARQISYVNFVGDIFLRMLKSLILPLIVSSLISAIGSLDLSLSGKIGVRAVSYYLATTICAVIIGIVVVVIIHPGRGDSDSISRSGTSRNVTTVDTLMDLFR